MIAFGGSICGAGGSVGASALGFDLGFDLRRLGFGFDLDLRRCLDLGSLGRFALRSASGFDSGAIEGASVRVGSILGVSSLDMECRPNG